MSRHSRFLGCASIAVASSLALSACGSNNVPTPTPTPTPTSVAKQEDQFGMTFGNLYRADPNSEPASVNDGDVIAVTLLLDPVNIN